MAQAARPHDTASARAARLRRPPPGLQTALTMAAALPSPAHSPPRRACSPAPTVLSPGIWRAAEAGDTAGVLRLLEGEGYTSVDARSTYQSTLLHAAAKHGHLELAAALLRLGADVSALDFGGCVSEQLQRGGGRQLRLRRAALASLPGGGPSLCSRPCLPPPRSSLPAPRSMRRTPLHWACKGEHVALVELFVAAGADTQVRTAPPRPTAHEC